MHLGQVVPDYAISAKTLDYWIVNDRWVTDRLWVGYHFITSRTAKQGEFNLSLIRSLSTYKQ